MSPRMRDSGSYFLLHSSLVIMAAYVAALTVEKEEPTLELGLRTVGVKEAYVFSYALDISQVGMIEPFWGQLKGTLPKKAF